MLSKVFLVCVLSLVYASTVTEVTLDEIHINSAENNIFGATVTIPKWWFDTLQTCYLITPDGGIVELYPNNNLQSNNIYFLQAADPFTTCAVGIRPITSDLAGAYALHSTISHSDLSTTIYLQKFTITVV